MSSVLKFHVIIISVLSSLLVQKIIIKIKQNTVSGVSVIKANPLVEKM